MKLNEHKGIIYTGANKTNRKEFRQIIQATEYGRETHTALNNVNDILGQVTYFTNMTNDVTTPSAEAFNAEWKSVGHSPNENTTISGLKLQPKRLISVTNVSSTLAKESKEFVGKLNQLIEHEELNKLIETMFSNLPKEEGENAHSKGLFNGTQTYNVDEITKAMLFVTNNNYNGTWIISPSVFAYILDNKPQYITDTKLCGFNYLVDGRVQDNYGCFVDLNKIAVADWTINSTTIDDVTHIVDGVLTYITETFVDFGIMNDKAIAVVKLEDTNKEQQSTK